MAWLYRVVRAKAVVDRRGIGPRQNRCKAVPERQLSGPFQALDRERNREGVREPPLMDDVANGPDV